jgi:2-dehydro-3-deoxyglucarate aldolase/4-hydroxy-2-oxoheptanedioate aldolase
MISELRDSQLPTIFKTAGFDFVILDFEHGGFDYKDLFNMIMNARLVGIHVIIRLANNARKDINKLMDMGADALLLPMTNNAQDIEEVVKYAKYSPIGKRGISTMRAHSLYNPGDINEYIKIANDRTKVFAQIETIQGVRNTKEILNLPGVDGFFIGPNDLSSDLGCLGASNSKEIRNVITELGKLAIELKKESGIITRNEAYLSLAKEVGINNYCVGSEISLLLNGGKETVKSIYK